MRIKYIWNDDSRVENFNELLKEKYPQVLTEENPELYLVAGGDGAMLHAIHDTIDDGIPYLGKALGTFNFLLNRIEDDERVLDDLLSDRQSIDFYNTNAIVAYLDGKKLGEAVNDVILGEELTGYHTFSLTTASGDFRNFEIKGSGICISTAVGSTAFNFNNNGGILPLDSDLLSLTGVVCNRYLNDIVSFEDISIRSNGARIYLTNVRSELLSEGSELVLKKGSPFRIGFLDKKDFLKRRVEIGHRFRK